MWKFSLLVTKKLLKYQKMLQNMKSTPILATSFKSYNVHID